MANLYEINEQILSCVDMETGEIIDADKLQDLQLAFDEKVEGIACWIKNLLSDAAAIKAEKDALAEREESNEWLSSGIHSGRRWLHEHPGRN